jgi:Domain of unknown function (DUF4174)
MTIRGSQGTPLDEYAWKDRVLVVSAPARDQAAQERPRIYEAAAKGMAVLAEALDDSDRSRQIRSRLAADGRRFKVFLVGKDHMALSSTSRCPADYLFGKVDAMPMRRDEMHRAR